MNKKTLLMGLIGLAVAIAVTVPVDAAMVTCLGTKHGGTGLPPGLPLPAPFLPAQPWDYLYGVSVNIGDHLNCFQVGTCDTNIQNYGGFIVSQNWITMVGGGIGALVTPVPQYEEAHHSLPSTPHGNIVGALPPPGLPGQGSGPDGLCPRVVRWMCPQTQMGAPAMFYFGFNNFNEPHDVGATVGDITLGQIIWDEDWQQPVGMGLGPVHGPVPEPATLSLLALGGLLTLRRRK